MNVLALLKKNHKKIVKILDKLSETSTRASKTLKTLFSQLLENNLNQSIYADLPVKND